MTNAKDNWVNLAVQVLRCKTDLRAPQDWFTAESFCDSLGPDLQPTDSRWAGAVFQRAKREGLIVQVEIKGDPLVTSTRAGHQTPVWRRRK